LRKFYSLANAKEFSGAGRETGTNFLAKSVQILAKVLTGLQKSGKI